jgi:hypothetical protein
METAMAELEGQGGDFAVKMMESGMAMAETAAANAVPLGYIGLLASALSLLGVWMMWNLKRTGYWIYIVARGRRALPAVHLHRLQHLGPVEPWFLARSSPFSSSCSMAST